MVINKKEVYPQLKAPYRKVTKHLKKNSKASVILPTGYGKTTVGLRLIQDNAQKGSKQVLIGPSDVIWNSFKEADSNIESYCHFFTYSALAKQPDPLKAIQKYNPTVVVLDELHRVGAKIWQKSVSGLFQQDQIKVLGLTATETRYLDNCRDMAEELFGPKNIVVKKTLGEAIQEGFYKKPRLITCLYSIKEGAQQIISKARNSKSSKTLTRVASRLLHIKKSFHRTSSIPSILKKHCEAHDYKFIAFLETTSDIVTMTPKIRQWFKKAFPRRTLKIFTVTHHNGKKENQRIIQQFLENKDPSQIDIILSVNILNESLHDPDLTCCLMLRRTKSVIINMQQIGRVLTGMSKKTPKIFDMVNNIHLINNTRYRSDSQQEENESETSSSDGRGVHTAMLENFDIHDEMTDILGELNKLDFRISGWYDTYRAVIEYKNKEGSYSNFYKKDPRLYMWVMRQKALDHSNALGKRKSILIRKLEIFKIIKTQKSTWEQSFAKFQKSCSESITGMTQDKELRRWFQSFTRKSPIRLSDSNMKLLKPYIDLYHYQNNLQQSLKPLDISKLEKKKRGERVKNFFLTTRKSNCCSSELNVTRDIGGYHIGKAVCCKKCNKLISSNELIGMKLSKGESPSTYIFWALDAFVENYETIKHLQTKKQIERFLGIEFKYCNHPLEISAEFIQKYKKFRDKTL